MIPECVCNLLVVTDLFERDYSSAFQQLQIVCSKENNTIEVITGVNDYWCRDFLPVQTDKAQYVQFRFDPSYYQHPQYKHLKTTIEHCNWERAGKQSISDLILDGGNLIYTAKQAIVTDRVFVDNKHLPTSFIVQTLVESLQLDRLVVIPAVPFELTGHADGMVRFLTEDTLLINDFRTLCSPSYIRRLERALRFFNLLYLVNGFAANNDMDDATGDYLNHICIGRSVVVPVYGCADDDVALSFLETCYRDCAIVPVVCNDLSKKGGVLHCATWQGLV